MSRVPVAARLTCLVRTSDPEHLGKKGRSEFGECSYPSLSTQSGWSLSSVWEKLSQEREQSRSALLSEVELGPVLAHRMADVPTDRKTFIKRAFQVNPGRVVNSGEVRLRKLDLDQGPQTQIFLEVRRVMNGSKELLPKH